MATDVTFYFLPGHSWWATGPRIEGFVVLAPPMDGCGPKYELPDAMHAIAAGPRTGSTFEFEMPVAEMRAALLACGHVERVPPGHEGGGDPYQCTPDECKMMATHVPECWQRADARRAAEEAAPSPAEMRAKAAGLERAIAILRESNNTCDDLYHNGCGCQDHLVWSMDLEARALRGEEF